MKIQNISNEIQCVSQIPAFQPNEIREVNEEESKRLLNNPYFALVKKAKKEETI